MVHDREQSLDGPGINDGSAVLFRWICQSVPPWHRRDPGGGKPLGRSAGGRWPALTCPRRKFLAPALELLVHAGVGRRLTDQDVEPFLCGRGVSVREWIDVQADFLRIARRRAPVGGLAGRHGSVPQGGFRVPVPRSPRVRAVRRAVRRAGVSVGRCHSDLVPPAAAALSRARDLRVTGAGVNGRSKSSHERGPAGAIPPSEASLPPRIRVPVRRNA